MKANGGAKISCRCEEVSCLIITNLKRAVNLDITTFPAINFERMLGVAFYDKSFFNSSSVVLLTLKLASLPFFDS